MQMSAGSGDGKSRPQRTQKFTNSQGQVALVFGAIGTIAMAVMIWLRVGPWASVPFVVLVVPFVLTFRMHVVTDRDGILIVNMLRSHRIAWGEVEDIGIGRNGLFVQCRGRKIRIQASGMFAGNLTGSTTKPVLDSLRDEWSAASQNR